MKYAAMLDEFMWTRVGGLRLVMYAPVKIVTVFVNERPSTPLYALATTGDSFNDRHYKEYSRRHYIL